MVSAYFKVSLGCDSGCNSKVKGPKSEVHWFHRGDVFPSMGPSRLDRSGCWSIVTLLSTPTQELACRFQLPLHCGSQENSSLSCEILPVDRYFHLWKDYLATLLRN